MNTSTKFQFHPSSEKISEYFFENLAFRLLKHFLILSSFQYFFSLLSFEKVHLRIVTCEKS